jgi:transposase-like protein
MSFAKKTFSLGISQQSVGSGNKEKIIEWTLDSSGVRDTGRALQINRNTVCAVLKKTLRSNSFHLRLILFLKCYEKQFF